MISTDILDSFIRNYGYWALLVGTFLEGETILMLGGLSAQLGYLDLSLVIVVAFIGSFSGDQFYFIVGSLKVRSCLRNTSGCAQESARCIVISNVITI